MARKNRFLLPLFFAVVAVVSAGCYASHPTPTDPFAGTRLGVPAEVTNRTPLYPCGTESRPQGTENYDEAARTCFWDHNQNRQEAEFVTVTSSAYTGATTLQIYLTLYYRTFSDGHIEIITDGRESPDIAGWTLRNCAGLEQAPAGDAPPGVTFFNGKDPCTQKYLLKAGS